MARARPRRSSPELIVRAATPSRWPQVEALFGERGACGGCWCMLWRRAPKDHAAGKGAGNRRAFKRLVESGGRPGVIGSIEGEPVAWCAIAPREHYPTLARSRVLAPLDERPVWSISCLFVLRSWRRRGLSARMIAGAVDFAARRGASVVEGYPVEPRTASAPDAFVWTGLPGSFRAAGFREVARRSPTRPIMRLELHRAARGRGTSS